MVGPGQTPVAVFRASDGVFVGDAVPGHEQAWTFRGGTYLIVADIRLETVLQRLGATPLGSLEVLPQDDREPPYLIWQFAVQGSASYPELGLKTTGRVHLPTPVFSKSDYRSHPFGPRVFTEKLPTIEIRQWSPELEAEFALRFSAGGIEREIPIPPTGQLIVIPVDAPCQWRLVGQVRGRSALSRTDRYRLTYHALNFR